MKNTESRLERSFKKLFTPFIKGTLKHSGSCNCAAGHLTDNSKAWFHLALSKSDPFKKELALESIRKSEYSPVELFEIEKAFEGRKVSVFQSLDIKVAGQNQTLFHGNDPEGWQGLQNVFETLYQLDKSEHESVGSVVQWAKELI
jgi:hypothetical protein